MNNIPNYKNILESLNYEKSEVQKYFDSLISQLNTELDKTLDSEDQILTNSYEKFEREISMYDAVKIDILKKYFSEYIELNENYNSEIISLDNETFINKQEILEKINKEKEIIKRIKGEIALELHEKIKPYTDHKKLVTESINNDYQKMMDNILDARDLIIERSAEFYNNSKNHIESIDKLIRFFNEYSEFENDFKVETSSINKESLNNKLNIYIEYIDNSINYIKNDSSFDYSFEQSDKAIDELLNNIDAEIALFNSEYKEYKDSLRKRFIENKNNNPKENLILSFESVIESTIFDKEIENSINIKNSIISLKEKIKETFTDHLYDNTVNTITILERARELLVDEKSSLDQLINKNNSSKELLNYFKKRFDMLDLERRVDLFSSYKEYLEESVRKNKELDALCYEILVSDLLLKMELLDLKREYLTCDDELSIKSISYDYNVKELKETKKMKDEISKYESDLKHLDKDNEIDKLIKKRELDNDVYVLDLRKKIDMLRCDYMVAYARLSNVEKILNETKDTEKNKIDLRTRIKIQKAIELLLLDAIDKKNKSDEILSEYDNNVNKIGVEKKNAINDLNEALLKENNDFNEKKKSLNKEFNEETKDAVSRIRDRKSKSGEIIKDINRVYRNKENKLINDNKRRDNPLSNKKLALKILDLEYEKEALITEIIISTTMKNSSDLERYNIKKERYDKEMASIKMEFSNNTSSLKTVDIIEKDYEERLKNLALLRDDAVFNKEDSSNNLNENVLKVYKELDEIYNKEIDEYRVLREKGSENVDTSGKILSSHMSVINNKLEQLENSVPKANRDYLLKMINESKIEYEKLLNERLENDSKLNELILEKEKNKDSFIKDEKRKNIEIKDSYDSKKESIIKTRETSTIDKLFEYNKLKKEVMSDEEIVDSKISIKLSDSIDNFESLEDEILNEVTTSFNDLNKENEEKTNELLDLIKQIENE